MDNNEEKKEKSKRNKIKDVTGTIVHKAGEGGKKVKEKAITISSKTKTVASASKEKAMNAIDQNGDGQIDSTDIIILGLKVPGIKVDREKFLRKEFSRKYSQDVVDKAINETPSAAGIPLEDIDKIVDEVIKFERNAVSGISTALGMPGGVAMAATIPADIAQYYGYMLRAAQKMLYLYGFPDLKISKEDGAEIDTETINSLTVCLGIMYGVAAANNAIKAVAKAFANGVEKKLMRAALTKGAIYPVVKSVAKWFGIRMTKEVFAGFFKKAIPVVGGIIGGGITFATFKPCCYRLKNTLRDTSLSNPDHVSTEEEEALYSKIKENVSDADYEEILEDEESQDNMIVQNCVKLDGIVEIPEDVSEGDFMEAFLRFMEDKGWYWNGEVTS
ncbi:MAG: EcsC family protein [Eubacterium sp.]|nr:EcsC family protein [Eubacterium sp.]